MELKIKLAEKLEPSSSCALIASPRIYIYLSCLVFNFFLPQPLLNSKLTSSADDILRRGVKLRIMYYN